MASSAHEHAIVLGPLDLQVSIGDLIFDVPDLAAYASSVMTLEPGEIIATGTPVDVGPVVKGNTITMEITGLGRLEVSVSARGAVLYEERTGAHLDPGWLRNRTGTAV
ncbi:fumarylacetoacetate hydrolase family protein [Streptomyces chartreusis]|uniref:Fumarylacetoacetate hydrolase family protein n=1 Tax=Streptomyces chartreusis TaxID=1969 RepID=A0A7I0Y8Z7_STRCX|nr:fumarylacetoacetate hydrolase family protein [Streptomyces chartreusis]QKZ15978.1 fumarylacetoacetate hydrolase family protein [Streptomyces chartreusis]